MQIFAAAAALAIPLCFFILSIFICHNSLSLLHQNQLFAGQKLNNTSYKHNMCQFVCSTHSHTDINTHTYILTRLLLGYLLLALFQSQFETGFHGGCVLFNGSTGLHTF